MVDLLRPVELDESLEKRVQLGGDKFVLGVRDARFSGNYVWAHVYASRVVAHTTNVPVKAKHGWFRSETRPERRAIEQLVPEFDVTILVAGRYRSFTGVMDDLRLAVRQNEAKLLNAGADLTPFYAALREIYEHYQHQYEASERMVVAIPNIDR